MEYLLFNAYTALHKVDPHREYLYVHTSRENLEIKEETCLGLRFQYEI